MIYKSGENFLDKIYADMRNSNIVNHRVLKSDTPEEKIKKYIDRLEKVHTLASKHNKLNLIKKFYYDKYVIKKLPENYVELQKKIDRESGRNEIEDTDSWRKWLLLNVQNNQQSSLDNWLNYFISNDSNFPTWYKVYAFMGMLKLGKYDKEKGEFAKRSDNTIEPYLDFNREILTKIYDVLKKNINKEDLTDDEVKALINGESFKKLYTYYLKNTNNKTKKFSTDGIWIRYEQGSDYKPLWLSLQGKNTGWCTAGEETAKDQIADGDFYVYYTKGKNGEYTEPCIAIRMEGKTSIREVRGVDDDQNINVELYDVVEEKLNDFVDKDNYLQKLHDMKKIAIIENKINNKIDLTKDDLIFIYEINRSIKGIDLENDPRIKEIRDKRNVRRDLALILGCSEKQVALSLDDFINNDIIIYYGDLIYEQCINKFDLSKLNNLKYIIGNFDDRSYEDNLDFDLENIDLSVFKNLKLVSGHMHCFEAKSAYGLNNLEYCGGYFDFSNIEDSQGLDNLQYIGKEAYFYNLENDKYLKNLKTISGSAHFNSLECIDGLTELETIGGDAEFTSLKEINGEMKLKTIGESFKCFNLKGNIIFKNLERIGSKLAIFNIENENSFPKLKSVGGVEFTNDDLRKLILKNELSNSGQDIEKQKLMKQKFDEAIISGGLSLGGDITDEEYELIMNGMLPERFWNVVDDKKRF